MSDVVIFCRGVKTVAFWFAGRWHCDRCGADVKVVIV